MADGGLGDVQLVGGLGEAEMPGGGFEGAEGVQGRQASIHRFGSIILIDGMRTDRLWICMNIGIFIINSHRKQRLDDKIF